MIADVMAASAQVERRTIWQRTRDALTVQKASQDKVGESGGGGRRVGAENPSKRSRSQSVLVNETPYCPNTQSRG